jgi:glycosyltransferase involved in cell wall biosynthesis
MPRFSIILPCYNAQATLADTLQSLLDQSFSDWEAICVDDGSTDATRDLIASFAARDARIQLVRNPRKGPSAARNHGARDLAKGDIIAFCDADDLWAPGKLRALQTAFADPKVGGAFGRIAFFETSPAHVSTTSTLPDGPLSVAMLLGENPVCTMSNIALRREVMQASTGFDESLVHNEDLDWLIRLASSNVQIIGINEVQVFYRNNPVGLSSDLSAMKRSRAEILRRAARLGHPCAARSEAIYLRYLARRALRLDQGRFLALRLILAAYAKSPAGVLSPARRGLSVTLAALIAPLCPTNLRHALFA